MHSGSPTRSRAILLGAIVLFLYLAMEWLFLVTKPSFTDMLHPLQRAELLANGYFLIATPFLICVAALALASPRIALSIVAGALACLLFLMVDNFLYTVLGWGTLGSPPIFRPLYTALLAGLFWIAYRQLSSIELPSRGLTLGLFIPLFLGFSVSTLTTITRQPTIDPGPGAASESIAEPNLLLVGIDGVEAHLLSAYGSRPDTTPFLESIASELVVFENAFPDSGKTTGSTAALLTGRSPLETKVGFPPQVLLGANSFLHLPGILNERGYRGFQYAVPYYADAVDLNLREAFHEVNGRRRPFQWLDGTPWIRWFNDELYFLQTLGGRLVKRLRYLFFVDDMLNHYLVVQENLGLGYEHDLAGVEAFETFAEATESPFYAQIHFMSTHCCRQSPRSSHFSSADFPGLTPEQASRAADRMNSVRDVDSLIERLYRFLAATGLLEDTILVVYSDHSYQWDSVWRVPLLIRLPGGAPPERRERNVLLSMLPGIVVEHLGFPRPSWMRPSPGEDDPDSASEPLFGLSSFEYRRYEIGTGGLSKMTDPGPPNYGVREISLILCSSWFKASLPEAGARSGEIQGHTAPCPEDALPPAEQIFDRFQREIERHGYVWGR